MPFISLRLSKAALVTVFLAVALVCLSACGDNSGGVTEFQQETSFADTSQSVAYTQEFVTESFDGEVVADIVLADGETVVSGDGVSFANNVLTVYKGGTYRISGTLADGKIYVNSADESSKVKLILSGVSIACSTDAPLYIENSPDETVLILEAGTVNSFSDTARAVPTDTEDYATAAIYSKDDLQLEGSGTLNVSGSFGRGIFSKNDIDIRGGVININATDDGIRGKDSVEIEDGIINIVCGGDGIRTSEETDVQKGNIDIYGGTVNIESRLDGIQATSTVGINGGTVTVKSGGGATELTTESYGGFDRFSGGQFPGGSYSTDETDTASTKGIKAEKSITVSSGVISADSLDDSIHAPEVTVGGGTLQLKSSDDGIHADELVTVTGGQINVAQSYEGVEGRNISINGGTLIINSADDGFNAASSDSTSATTESFGNFNLLYFGGNPGGMMGYDSSCNINLTDGMVIINAQGDGVDSNGSVTMTGGKMIVYGPTNGGNGALDYGGSFNVSGGTLLAIGSAGMAQSVTGNGVQVLNFRANGMGDTVYSISDSSGNCLIGFTAVKSFESVVFASDRLSQNESYSFYSDATVTGYTDSIYGICFDGVCSGGTAAATLS